MITVETQNGFPPVAWSSEVGKYMFIILMSITEAWNGQGQFVNTYALLVVMSSVPF
jgi:hypothetical protein